MGTKSDLDAFLRPRSVAVVGATERPGAWGSFIMSGLLSLSYPGKIYPVNRQADHVFGIPASKDIGEIEGPVDLAVLAIPDESVEKEIRACSRKKVKGITIITAGFGETSTKGREKQEALAGNEAGLIIRDRPGPGLCIPWARLTCLPYYPSLGS